MENRKLITLRLLALKLVRTFFIAVIVTLGSFVITAILPGDPAELALRDASEAVSQEKIEQARHILGLDKSAWLRAVAWLQGVASLDFGRSYRTGELVSREILSRIGYTATLAFSTVACVIPCSVLGAWASVKSRRLRTFLSTIGFLGYVVPDYILGLGLILIAGILLKIPAESLPFLPVLTLGLPMFSFYLNVSQTLFVQAINSDFIRFAYAKGLSERTIFFKHTLPFVIPSLLAPWAMSVGRLLAGAIVVETIFGLPGVGRLFVDSLLSRDYPVIQTLVLWSGWTIGVLMSLADLITSFMNVEPQIAGTDER